MLPSSLFLLLAWASMSLAFDGTTTFDSILVAHPEPTICPPATGFDSYLPDANYVACCNHWFGVHTLTTGVGPGSKKVYGCCLSGYSCTAPVSLMKDWSIDSSGDLQTRDLPNPPTPTADPAAGITPAARSTGTISRPGATPITTSAGVVVYVSNENNNNNGNNINIGNTSGSSPSPGAIAGITVACTVVSAVAAVLGVWYARKQAKAKRMKQQQQQGGDSVPEAKEQTRGYGHFRSRVELDAGRGVFRRDDRDDGRY